MYFVAGITGKVGGAAAQYLLDRGHKVRGIARDLAKAEAWVAKGVEVRQGDFTDAAAMAAAMNGVEGAFVMVPPFVAPAPGYPESMEVIGAVTAALEKALPPRVVALSSIGSEKESGLGLITATHLLEQALAGLTMPVAFVRAGGFFENFAGALAGARATGTFYTMYAPEGRAVPMIATRDIGAEVGRLLVEGWEGARKIVELGSKVSQDELAAAMGEVLGKPVKAQSVPRERWTATIEQFGIPAGRTWAYEEMMDGMNSGWIDFGVAGTEAVAGTTKAVEVFAGAVG